jgi:hypothetical protein
MRVGIGETLHKRVPRARTADYEQVGIHATRVPQFSGTARRRERA